MIFELDNNKRREDENREIRERHAEVQGVFQDQRLFALGPRSDLAAGNGLSPGDQQYTVTHTETGKVSLIFDRRAIGKKSLAADIRRQLEQLTLANLALA